jgi:ribosomal protein RSM22 (predicted rRNA methylase)
MHQRRFHLPPAYEPLIESALEPLGHSLNDPLKLSQAVRKLSDYYLSRPEGKTPWKEPWAQAASLAYYFPLNYARNRAVALEAHRLGFFAQLDEIVDFGCGMGSALHAFLDLAPDFQAVRGLDVSSESLELCRALCASKRTQNLLDLHLVGAGQTKRGFERNASARLFLASYVYTELEELPHGALESEAIAIVEPSTQADGRRLMKLRQKLIDSGYQIWAPCTHMDACPLLIHSEKDWCHDRIHWDAPSWFSEMEKHLPMKNRTLTFSYLLARKTTLPPAALAKLARLTGDTLIEKGKNRQSVCRGPEREFLAWFPQRMPKDAPAIELKRGNLINLKGSLEKKASEVRLSHSEAVVEIPPESLLTTNENPGEKSGQ